MPYIRVYIDADEVVEELETEELEKELERRGSKVAPAMTAEELSEALDKVLRDIKEPPQSLRDLLYAVNGKII